MMWWVFKRKQIERASDHEYQEQTAKTEQLERVAKHNRRALRDAFDRIDMVIEEVKRKGGPRGAQ